MSAWSGYSQPEPVSPLDAGCPPRRAQSRAVNFLTAGRSTPDSTGRRPTTGESHEVHATPNGQILIVDDDAAIRDALRDILESEGYPISTAADGAAALRQIEVVRPALLLLDMRMPGISGWDVAAALRQRNIAVPILVMTAARDARHWAEQIGAHGYLAKPFDLDDLLESVARLLHP